MTPSGHTGTPKCAVWFFDTLEPCWGIFVILHAIETFDGVAYLSLWVLAQALNLSPSSFESRSQLTLKMQDTVKSERGPLLCTTLR